MNDSEEWRPVLGWEGLYEVSSLGRVRSLDRTATVRDGRVRSTKGRVMKPKGRSGGHQYVDLKSAGRIEASLVHRLVARAFIPNPENKPHVLHWDDDPGNNERYNLRWGDDAENRRDALRNGRVEGGSLSREDVVAIRGLYSRGDFDQTRLAEKYSVTPSMICKIVKGKARVND